MRDSSTRGSKTLSPRSFEPDRLLHPRGLEVPTPTRRAVSPSLEGAAIPEFISTGGRVPCVPVPALLLPFPVADITCGALASHVIGANAIRGGTEMDPRGADRTGGRPLSVGVTPHVRLHSLILGVRSGVPAPWMRCPPQPGTKAGLRRAGEEEQWCLPTRSLKPRREGIPVCPSDDTLDRIDDVR